MPPVIRDPLRDANEPPHDPGMPFLDHLRELRRRLFISMAALFIGFIVGYLCYHSYIGFLTRPFGETLHTFTISEAFMARFRIGFYAGIVLSFPVHVYNIVAFILPALTGRERRWLASMLAGSFLLLMAGGYTGYFQILPMSIDVLKSVEFLPQQVDMQLRFDESVDFVLQLVLGFLILFQLPLVLIVLMALGLVKRRWLWRGQRLVIMAILIVAAILTPPDVTSMMGLAIPLILLFYLTIFIAKVFRLGESADDTADDDDEPEHEPSSS